LFTAPIISTANETPRGNFLPVVLDDGTVSNNDLIEVPIKYPLHGRAHALVIGIEYDLVKKRPIP
jgi:hypothetical protein